jgi:iron complex outermembrane receptor protein
VSALHAARQDRPSVFESDTPGYTRIDAELAHTWTYGNTVLTAFAQVRNLLNEDIRLSTSFIRDVAPMPGRTVWFGLRARL